MINTIDLFAGCGGLTEGFARSGYYNMLAAIDWEKTPVANLRNRMLNKWGYKDAAERILCFDIQRVDELFEGWKDDPKFGSGKGMDALVGKQSVDMIIGGPPCQAYSIAGRVSNDNSNKNNDIAVDYRNFLFESYMTVVNRYRPKFILFENVPGMLSAKVGNQHVIDLIRKQFDIAGYAILSDLKKAIIDCADYGVPQYRKRVIILGINKKEYGSNTAEEMLDNFYFGSDYLKKYMVDKYVTVKDAIGGKQYPVLKPTGKATVTPDGIKTAHSVPKKNISNHVARWQNERDIEIFRLLAEDIETGNNQYVTIESLKRLYTEKTGKTSNVHKYHVLRWDEPSNLIPAHLYKDGLRHIHPDSKQARSITVREAAKLQSFSDDYIFEGNMMDLFKMIGNAVPPLFAECCANALHDLMNNYNSRKKGRKC